MQKLSLVITIVLLLEGIAEALNYAVVPFLNQYNSGGAVLGIASAAFAIGGLCVVLPAGLLSDRIPARTLTLAGLLILVVATGVLASRAVTNVWLIIGLFVVSGVGLETAYAAFDILFYKTIAHEHKSRLIGYLGAGKSLAAGTMTFATLALAGGSFAIGGTLAAISACAVMATIAVTRLPRNVVFRTTVADYTSELANPLARRLLLLIFLFNLHSGGDNVASPWIWQTDLGLSFFEFGLLAGGGIAIVITTVKIFAARYTHHAHIAWWCAVVGLILSALGHVGIGLAETFATTMVARATHLVGDGLFTLFYATEIAWLYSRKTLGGQLGLATLAICLAQIISRIGAGVWSDYFGFRSVMFVTAGVMLATAVVVIVTRVRLVTREVA